MTIHSPLVVADADASVFPTLLRVLKLTRAYQNLRLAEIGLQNGQDEFLLALDTKAPKPVCQLARELGVRASTVSKMIDVLSAKGLVERARSEQDHRSIMVHPTPAGMALRQAIHEIWDGLDVELIQSATELNSTSLQRDLAVLEAHVGKRLARLRNAERHTVGLGWRASEEYAGLVAASELEDADNDLVNVGKFTDPASEIT